MMKKFVAILLVLLSVVLCCAACKDKAPDTPDVPVDTGESFVLSNPSAYTVIVNEYA